MEEKVLEMIDNYSEAAAAAARLSERDDENKYIYIPMADVEKGGYCVVRLA